MPKILQCTLLVMVITSIVLFEKLRGQSLYDYPSDVVMKPLNDQIFSPLTWEQARKGVPEIKLISKEEEEIKYIGNNKHLIDPGLWQESPSRIIFNEGKYHTWIMQIVWHLELYNSDPAYDYSDFKNYYLTSYDGYQWNVESEIPAGEPGSFDDKRREGLQVVKWDGKFWMFYAGVSKNTSKYRSNFTGIGLLVSDSPEGPWERAVDKPLLCRSDNPEDWDYDMMNNPYPLYYKGKWFIYYKSRNEELSGSGRTLQGVAVANNITGPYVKFKDNPICDGHGSFVWAWRGGITMLPFGMGGGIHWSPDGLHWHNVDNPASRGIKSPLFSAFYLPNDPLCGDPTNKKEPDIIWGLETRTTKNTNPRDWSIFRGTVTFNEVRKNENK